MEFEIRSKLYVSFGALVLQAARPKPVRGERDSAKQYVERMSERKAAGSGPKIEAEGRSL